MRFSVVIPLYNKAYAIERCIGSVTSQTCKNFEIIIVNDGSTDDSLSIVSSSFINEIDKGIIKIFNQANQGVSVARNKGISLAESDYVCFLDADDEWKPDFLHQMNLLIQDFPSAVLYFLQHETKIEDQPAVRNSSYYRDGYRGYVNNFYRASLFGRIAHSSKVCIKKEELLKLGGFPENQKSGEDLYVWLELARLGKVAFFNKVCSRINIEKDLSRAGRSDSIPYPLVYYSTDNNHERLSFWAKLYLRRVYLAHIKQSIQNKQYNSAVVRADAGKRLFPILNKVLIIGIKKISS